MNEQPISLKNMCRRCPCQTAEWCEDVITSQEGQTETDLLYIRHTVTGMRVTYVLYLCFMHELAEQQ